MLVSAFHGIRFVFKPSFNMKPALLSACRVNMNPSDVELNPGQQSARRNHSSQNG